MRDGVTAGERPDGVVAQHDRLVRMNEDIREKTGEAYLVQTVHDGQHKYFFQGSDWAVIGIDAALAVMDLKWREVFHIGPPEVA